MGRSLLGEQKPSCPACCAVTAAVLLAKSLHISIAKRLPELVCVLDCDHCCFSMWGWSQGSQGRPWVCQEWYRALSARGRVWVPSWGLLSPAGGGKAVAGAGTPSRQSVAVVEVLLWSPWQGCDLHGHGMCSEEQGLLSKDLTKWAEVISHWLHSLVKGALNDGYWGRAFILWRKEWAERCSLQLNWAVCVGEMEPGFPWGTEGKKHERQKSWKMGV